MIRFDSHELAALSIELPRLGFKGARVVDAVLAEGAQQVEAAWRRNAEQTSGEHGRLYPKSIDHERLLGLGLSYEIGPNPAKPQGGMSFEEGSVKQPPHHDGLHAADEVVPKVARRVDSALGLLGL